MPITEALSCRISNDKYTLARQAGGQQRGLCLTGLPRVFLPLADRIETIIYDNGKELASRAKIATSLASLCYLPSHITHGNVH
jgi:hypothetical protein